MTVIQTGSTPLTLINVFTVAPERQDVLIAHLQDALRTASGVISDQRRVGPGSDPKPRTPLRCA